MHASLTEMQSRPDARIATVTAGLKWAPETEPRAKIIHINPAAMDHTGAWEPPITFNPTPRTNMYVPRNSLASFETMGGPSAGASAPGTSSGRTSMNNPAARAAPTNSKRVYGRHQ